MIDQEYINLHYITGGRMNKKTKPEEPRLTPGETVVLVLLITVAACIAVAGIANLIRLAL